MSAVIEMLIKNYYLIEPEDGCFACPPGFDPKNSSKGSL